MTGTARTLPDAAIGHLQLAKDVFAALEAGGYVVRAAGGFVRDSLLHRSASDVDLATDAVPEETIRLARAAGLKTIETGLQHGTVTVLASGHGFEVTTLRRDIETDGRHAQVEFTSNWIADAGRRDFTINALYCSREGVVFDPLGGLADLDPVRVRFIGQACERIREDYLRILRFFRFSAVYAAGAALDPDGLAACAAGRDGLSRISGERIRTELLKLLAAPGALPVVIAMAGCGVLAAAVPLPAHIAALSKLDRIQSQLGFVPDALVRLAALLADEVPEDTRLSSRLKLSGRERDRISAMARTHRRVLETTSEAGIKRLIYEVGRGAFLDALAFAWARSERKDDDTFLTKAVGLSRNWAVAVFPLRGADLCDAGFTPGRSLGALLDLLEDRWISSDYRLSRDELLDLARQLRRQRDAGD